MEGIGPEYFGYWCSHFLTLWSQIETVLSEPADANVLYLASECESAHMKLGRCRRYGMEKKGKDVHRMESGCVNRPHVVYIINSLSVALECIFLVLDLWTWVKVFHINPAFDRTNHIACGP